jgi:RNA polymerase sigma factor (sigma-70 family)
MTGRATSAAITPVRPAAADATRDLYARHGQRVQSFCMSRLRNVEEAQDAAQTTFVSVLSALNRGVVPRNELAWLLTIADNTCRSARRSLGRRLARFANADVDELEAAATSFGAETNETLDALRHALGDLPDTQRRAILLREWQGLGYADIADQLHLSVPAVETLLFRARRGLAARLEGERARRRALDLGSVLAFVRSLLGGAAGKVAVGAAGVALVVSVPGGEHPVRAARPSVAPTAAAVPAAAPRRLASLPETIRRRGVPRVAHHRPAVTTRSRVARRPAVRPVRAVATEPAPARFPPPAATPVAPSTVTPPLNVPAAAPVELPIEAPTAVQNLVTTATQTAGTVVTTATQVVPVPVLP